MTKHNTCMHALMLSDFYALFVQEREDQAVYCNARILDVRREEHDSSECSCAFLVRYDRNGIEVGSLVAFVGSIQVLY